MKLKVRCPSCAKLYEVMSEEIQTDTPVFQCMSCESRFGFEFPPADANNVLAFIVPNTSAKPRAATQQEIVVEEAKAQTEPLGQQEMKSCPKCGALNGRRAHECYSCHVLFDRLEGLPQDTSLRAQPSLVRKWKNVLENFENTELHDEFIRSCVELDAHRFAIMKYEEIKAAQGGDALCDQMIAKVNSLMLVSLSQKPVAKEGAKVSDRPKWMKWIFIGPFAFSALLILWGVVSLGHRNLIGVGVALACMAAGLIIIVRGQFYWSDFTE